MTKARSPRKRALRVLALVGLLAAIGISVFSVMLRNWTVVRGIDGVEADRRLGAILDSMEDRRPYFEVGDGGELIVHRELESDDAKPVSTLAMVLWQPGRGRWVRTDFPMWFIRVKTGNGIPLGPIKAALAEDWKELSLEVTGARISHRGPGLVLHLESPGGRQLLLWNEPSPVE